MGNLRGPVICGMASGLLVATWGCGPASHDVDAKATTTGLTEAVDGAEDGPDRDGTGSGRGTAGSGDMGDEVGRDSEATPPEELTYYEHAKPIIDAKCASCHSEGGIGPMKLTTYDEVEPVVGLVGHAIENDLMPPWTADAPLDHFVGDRRLSPEQKELVLNWIEQGAKEGDSDDEPEPLTDTTPRRLAQVDLDLAIPEYEPLVEPDDYRCFPLEWPETETTFITGLDIVPGDRSIVHHAIVYLIGPDGADAVRERDAEEDGPGYSCFGSGTGTNAWLQSYEPGGYAQEIPGKLGFQVEPGSIMLLQVHYNTLNGKGRDQSHVEFTLKDRVDRVGRVGLFMNVGWLAGFMPIPANRSDVVHSYLGRPLGAPLAPQLIYWVDLHMHALGSSGLIGIVRADRPGEIEPLLQIPVWDFAWQETYILKEPVELGPFDQLYLECHFDNSAANQVMVDGERLPSRDVNWGDGTTDEMCLGNVLLAPLP